jgi:hypothetical protein
MFVHDALLQWVQAICCPVSDLELESKINNERGVVRRGSKPATN